jgi:hypothetical protein
MVSLRRVRVGPGGYTWRLNIKSNEVRKWACARPVVMGTPCLLQPQPMTRSSGKWASI